MKDAGAAPLFDWQGLRKAALLQAERERMVRRIAKLPARSPRRIGLEMLLSDLTRRTLLVELGQPAAADEERP